MQNIDVDSLRKAISHFKFYSGPSNASGNAPCTVSDIKNVIDGTAKLFEAFLKEIENNL